MTRPRILSVITRLADGGSERRLFDVLRALPDCDHVVVVGRDSHDDMIARANEQAEVTVCRSLVREVSPKDDAAALVSLIRLMRRDGVDLVHTHQSKAGLLGRVAAATAARRAPVVHSASMASFGPGYSRAQSAAFYVAERITQSLVDRYFVVGDDLASRLRGAKVPAAHLQIVRSTVDTERFRAAQSVSRADARRQLGLPDDGPIVCYVGSLSARKRVLDLPHILDSVRERVGADVRLVIAGHGADEQALRDELRTRGLADAVTFLGFTTEVPTVMAASNALVLPSSAEGLPQVLVQAGSVGVPFAAYDVDGVREVVRLGAMGIGVPLGRIDHLSTAVASLVLSPPELRRPLDQVALSGWSSASVDAAYRAGYRALGIHVSEA